MSCLFAGRGELRRLVSRSHFFLAAITSLFYPLIVNGTYIYDFKKLWPHGDAGCCFSVLIKFWLIFFQINPDSKRLPKAVKRYLQLWKEEISSSIWRPRPILPRSNTNGPKMETVAVASQNCQRHCLNPGKNPKENLGLV